MLSSRRHSSAFTLVELLVVVAIIGVLVTLLLPAIQAAREAGRRSQCQNNLKNLTLALLNYETATGHLPPGRYGCDRTLNCSPYSWVRGPSGFLKVLPYLEQQALFDSIDFEDGPWSSFDNAPERDLETAHNANARVIGTMLPIMNCPSDSKEPYVEFKSLAEATSSYAFCSGTNGPSEGISSLTKYTNNGVFRYLSNNDRFGLKLRQITDGTSHTIFLGETRDGHLQATRNRWTAAGRHIDSMRTTDNPMNTDIDEGWIELDLYDYKTVGSFASRHPDGVQFAFGDGHVEFLREDISTDLYRALSTRAGAEILE